MSCYHAEDGGFGASPRNDSHLLSTLSALQILALLDQLERADTNAVAACEETHAATHTGCGLGAQRSLGEQQRN
jgi:MoxR-like ATPase